MRQAVQAARGDGGDAVKELRVDPGSLGHLGVDPAEVLQGDRHTPGSRTGDPRQRADSDCQRDQRIVGTEADDAVADQRECWQRGDHSAATDEARGVEDWQDRGVRPVMDTALQPRQAPAGNDGSYTTTVTVSAAMIAQSPRTVSTVMAP